MQQLNEQQSIPQFSDRAIEEGRREMISWDHIMTCTEVLPELEQAAHEEIRKRMGYLPNSSAYVHQEVFIRTLIHQSHSDQVSHPEFEKQVDFHVKQVRNTDIIQGGFIDNIGPYTDRDLYRFDTHYSSYMQRAKQRLKFLLGSEPELEYALYAELMIRELCAMDWYIEEMPPTAIDYKAISIIQYRRAYIVGGKEFANNLPLLCS